MGAGLYLHGPQEDISDILVGLQFRTVTLARAWRVIGEGHDQKPATRPSQSPVILRIEILPREMLFFDLHSSQATQIVLERIFWEILLNQ